MNRDDQFDLLIGRLDRLLSQLIFEATVISTTHGEPFRTNRQTLKHHAKDMIEAGQKILELLGEPRPTAGPPQFVHGTLAGYEDPATQSGARGMHYGDRVRHTITGRVGIAGEFLPDGDCDITWEDDGSSGQVKWNHLEPWPRRGTA